MRNTTCKPGFSLPEMFFAVMFFGMGFTMIMTVFPIAVKDHLYVDKALTGSIVAENALETARMGLRHIEYPDGRLMNPFSVPEGDNMLAPPVDTKIANIPFYPSEYPNKPGVYEKGALIIGRYYNVMRNDYQLIAVAYKKLVPDQPVVLKEIDGYFSVGNDTDFYSVQGHIQIGTPLIDRNTGRFSFIISPADDARTHWTLDRPLGLDPGAIESQQQRKYYVLEQTNCGIAPFLAIRVTRTILSIPPSP